jgi:hypothetical protein
LWRVVADSGGISLLTFPPVSRNNAQAGIMGACLDGATAAGAAA